MLALSLTQCLRPWNVLAQGGVYKPSAEDVGARICVRGCLLPSPGMAIDEEVEDEGVMVSAFGEIGPLSLDPLVEGDLSARLAQRTSRFRGLQDPQYSSVLYDLEVDETGVSLWVRDRPFGEEEEEEEGVVATTEEGGAKEHQHGDLLGRGHYSTETLVSLHPGSTTLLALQLPMVGHESEEGESLACTLVCESRHQRDVLVLVWRTFRHMALPEGTEVDDARLNVEVPGPRTVMTPTSQPVPRAVPHDQAGETTYIPSAVFGGREKVGKG